MGYRDIYTPILKPLPVIYITSKALSKLQGFISLAEGEISGLGEVEKHGEKDFLITDLLLFDQECSQASTELDPDKLVDFMSEAMDEGRDLGKIKLWWHSHGEFGPSWSLTDDDTIDGLKNSGWMLFVVGSKKLGYRVRLDVFKPIRLTLDGLRFIHLVTHDELTLESLKGEFAEKVHIISEGPIPAGGNNG